MIRTHSRRAKSRIPVSKYRVYTPPQPHWIRCQFQAESTLGVSADSAENGRLYKFLVLLGYFFVLGGSVYVPAHSNA